MSQLSIGGASVTFGATTVFRDVTFTVERGEKWGVVGRNGSGKTTLFSLLTGDRRPDAGSVARESSLRISLLDQHRDFGSAATVWDAAAQPFAELFTLERSLAEQADQLAVLGESLTPEHLDRYAHDLERF